MRIKDADLLRRSSDVIVSFTDEERVKLAALALARGASSIEELVRQEAMRALSGPARPRGPDIGKEGVASKPVFKTALGSAYCADSCKFMSASIPDGSIDLVMTSPPFGLVTKKKYGNESAANYSAWFAKFAEQLTRILKPDGSLVIDIGPAWNKGLPTKSIYQYELLVMLCQQYGFHLAQEFFWWNPSRLPTPAEWVNVRRIRFKDAINCVWWLSLTPYPKASNRRALQPYSRSMKSLLANGYKAMKRPSGHAISKNFRRDNGGAIPPNLIALANTESNSYYQRYCRERGLPVHPARFPAGLPAFFINCLTNQGDLVLDPFAGSGVTPRAAESLGRRWISIELERQYVLGARGRFLRDAPTGLGDERKPYAVFPPTILPNHETPIDGGAGEVAPARRRPGK